MSNFGNRNTGFFSAGGKEPPVPIAPIIILGAGSCSTLRCGSSNTSSACYSASLSGKLNTASGIYSAILGGRSNNTCTFADSFIIGSNLLATQACTTFVNCLSAANLTSGCSVCVGTNGILVNTAPPVVPTAAIIILGSGTCSALRCGVGNTASGNYSTVLGKSNNTSSCYSSIVGGLSNTIATSFSSFIGGGCGNTIATSCASSIINGDANAICNSCFSTISGGCCNIVINNVGGAIGGGKFNTASGAYSSIAGGLCNVASGCYSSVSVGNANIAAAPYSSVLGGIKVCSYLYGQSSFSSGSYNTAAGDSQNSNLIAWRQAVLNANGTAIMSLDGTGVTNLLIPAGNNRAWNVTINTVMVVTNLGTGTSDSLAKGAIAVFTDSFFFKKSGGVSSISSITNSANKNDAGMASSNITFAVGGSGELSLIMNAPSTAGTATTLRATSIVRLVELAWI